MIKIDKGFIIALKDNIASNEESLKKRAAEIPLLKDVPLELIEATDGRSLDNDSLRSMGYSAYPEWTIKSDDPFWNRPLKNGELGCAISHWRIWKKSYEENLENIMVLEEDFAPVFDNYDDITTAGDWDLIYLGRSLKVKEHESSEEAINDLFVRPAFSYQSHAYILSRNALKKILFSGFDSNLIPVDEFLPTLYTQHPRPDIRKMFQPSIKAIAPKRSLIIQYPMEQSTTENFTATKIYDLEDYMPLHPELYNGYGKNTDAWVNRFVDTAIVQGQFDLVCDEPIDNLFVFPLLTEEACSMLIEEAEHFAGWTTNRHKNFPTTDMLLGKFGMDLIYSYVIKRYVYPLIVDRYRYYMQQLQDIALENFIARYQPDQQKHLNCHHDGSLLSMVVSLNTDFEGGGTYFPKYKHLVKHPKAGYASLFPGVITHYHGGRPVTKGTRYIIASFIGRQVK